MRTRRRRFVDERGVATIMVAILMLLFMSCVGLAIDLGRVYIIRAALSTASDGAALAAARQISQGTTAARTAADKIFDANFPAGYLGASGVTKSVSITVNGADNSDIIKVSGTATIPTLFMQLAGVGSIDVASAGTATRRLIDMAFVIDRSGSLGGQFPAVKTAASKFVGYFDDTFDRIALLSFSTNTRVHDPIETPARGFNKGRIQGDINSLPLGGNTATAEGLYQAWDQLHLVPVDNQSGLRVVVLFTDGTPNSWAGQFQRVATACPSTNPSGACNPSGSWVVCSPILNNCPTGTLVTDDYPAPAGQNDPAVHGLFSTYNAVAGVYIAPTNANYSSGNNTIKTTVNPGIPELPNPPQSTHTPQTGSGLPLHFLLFDGSLPHQRPIIPPGPPPYPNHVQNANNAARNLMEGVANAIRSDTSGKARIHIYALGLGAFLNQGTGSDLETGSNMLRRTANDPASPDYNPNQPEGGYFFAGSTAELDAAFQAIRDRIIRISQ